MLTADKQFLEKLNRLIEANLDNQEFTVDLICQTLGISRSQLHRTLKEQTDLSTSLYIRKHRLLKAKQLLLTTDLRISGSNPACEGIMDGIHTSVSLIKNLKDIARSSSDKHKYAQKSIWQMRTLGRLYEAISYSTKAVALDLFHPILMSGHIVNLAFADRVEEAQASVKMGEDLFNKSVAFNVAIGDYWLAKGDYDQAINRYQQALVLNSGDRSQINSERYCNAKRGKRTKAIQFLRELTATTPRCGICGAKPGR